MKLNRTHHINALAGLKKLGNNSINCVVTSPPYWALRDYGVKDQIGLENTYQEYITKLCDIFDQVKRVLTPGGTVWIVLGDTYGGTGDKGKTKNPKYPAGRPGQEIAVNKEAIQKCLMQIPARVSIEMIKRGWILRNKIIWHKPNCLPESVKDRFTVNYEEILFFTKSKKYYFEQQREPVTSNAHDIARMKAGRTTFKGKWKDNKPIPGSKQTAFVAGDPIAGRNKRAVWSINPVPFKGAHFAVFPQALIETPIKAGCPGQVCKKCGKAREKLITATGIKLQHHGITKTAELSRGRHGNTSLFLTGTTNEYKYIGLSNCGCNASWRPGIVLDPFMGSGTTGIVAKKLGRDFIGFEINQEYVNMANERTRPYLEQTKLQVIE